MKEPDKTNNDASQADSSTGGVGDVETAGETTAASAISGPDETKAVGADTMVKVSDASEADEDAEAES